VIVNMKLIFSPGERKVRMGMQDLASNDRAEALQAAKLTVRAYARDPSSKNRDPSFKNEAGVEEALRRVRRFDSVARWWGSKTALPGRAPAPRGYLGESAILH
jgi:hypothetical protein